MLVFSSNGKLLLLLKVRCGIHESPNYDAATNDDMHPWACLNMSGLVTDIH